MKSVKSDEKITLENITSVDAYGREVVFDVGGSLGDEQGSLSLGSRIGASSPLEVRNGEERSD